VIPDIAVLTAVYDGYDVVRPALHQHGVRVEWVCVTDDPELRPEGWSVVGLPRPGMHPNRAAKQAKLHPWQFTEAPVSVWVDASFRVTSGGFAEQMLDALQFGDVAQFVHPWRDCVYEEAAASMMLTKYDGEPVREQAQHYLREGHPEHWGLWAAGVIARRHTRDVVLFGDRWAREIGMWSFQDQISEPVALRESGLRPVSLWGTHMANPWLQYEGSGRH
jgi:hypothetical protein